MNDFELAKQKGVHGVEAKGFMSYSTDAKGKINVDYDATVKAMARDAAFADYCICRRPLRFHDIH